MSAVKDRVRGIRETVAPGTILGRLQNAGAGPVQQIPMQQLGIGGPNSQLAFGDNETPTGTINGANKTFTLSHPPSPAGSLILFLSGTLQRQGTDYTLSGTTITYTAAPAGGSWHLAWYRY